MSSEVNGTAKFYLFIANNFQGSTDKMVTAMDNNSDGYLIKAEFTKYMKAHWAGNFTEGELNQFWSKFDQLRDGKIEGTNLRNLNALDEDELKKLEAQVGVYNNIKEYIEEKLLEYQNLVAEFGIDPNKFSNSVKESLFNKIEEHINDNFESPNLEEELKGIVDANIETSVKMTVANLFAQNYILSATNTLEFNALGYKGDDDLQNIINSYIRSGNLNLDSIKQDIKAIVDAYLSTIQPEPTVLEGNLANYNWSGSGLNGLQTLFISKMMRAALSADASRFAGMEDDFNSIMEQFFQDKMNSGMNFQSMIAAIQDGSLVEEFRNSNQYKALEVLVNYLDIPQGGDNGGSSRGTSDTANTVDRYGTESTKGTSQSKSGSNVSPASALYSKIAEKYDPEFAEYVAEHDTDPDYGYQDIVRAVAAKVANGQLSASQAPDAIVDGLDPLYKAWWKEVNGVGGSTGSGETPDDDELITATWSKTSTRNVSHNTSIVDVHATLTNYKGEPVTSTGEKQITYDASGYDSSIFKDVSINSNGKLKFTTIGTSLNGTYYIPVSVMYDGEVVSTQQVQVEVVPQATATNSLQNYIGTGRIELWSIWSGDGRKKWSDVKSYALSYLNNNYIEDLKTQAKHLGFDSDDAENAGTTLYNMMSAIFNAMDTLANDGKDHDGMQWITPDAWYDPGTETSGNAQYSVYYYSGANAKGKTPYVNADASSSGVYITGDKAGSDSGYGIYVQKEKLAAFFCNFLH